MASMPTVALNSDASDPGYSWSDRTAVDIISNLEGASSDG